MNSGMVSTVVLPPPNSRLNMNNGASATPS